MATRVQKYGGSSVATSEQIQSIASAILGAVRSGDQFIVVLSAMGDTTDHLCELAQKISLTPSRREMDMLLSTGERVSMALMSIALNDQGANAVSFTGSQAGVLTDDSHNNARILDLKPIRVQDALTRNQLVVLAGFQGVSPTSKEITTLGRGGSDLTAVAMAAYFKVKTCEIMKDVDGVYSGDPRLIAHAVHRPHLHFDHLLELTYWGSPVLYYRSVELAERLNLPITIAVAPGHVIGPAHVGRQTLIDGDKMIFEQPGLVSINSHESVVLLSMQTADWGLAMSELRTLIDHQGLPWPQILDSEKRENQISLYITAPQEQLVSLKQILKQKRSLVDLISDDLSSVTATAFGSVGSELSHDLIQQLKTANIEIEKLHFSPRSLSVFVKSRFRKSALEIWHHQIKPS